MIGEGLREKQVLYGVLTPERGTKGMLYRGL